jgi:hypothetical protein
MYWTFLIESQFHISKKDLKGSFLFCEKPTEKSDQGVADEVLMSGDVL